MLAFKSSLVDLSCDEHRENYPKSVDDRQGGRFPGPPLSSTFLPPSSPKPSAPSEIDFRGLGHHSPPSSSLHLLVQEQPILSFQRLFSQRTAASSFALHALFYPSVPPRHPFFTPKMPAIDEWTSDEDEHELGDPEDPDATYEVGECLELEEARAHVSFLPPSSSLG